MQALPDDVDRLFKLFISYDFAAEYIATVLYGYFEFYLIEEIIRVIVAVVAFKTGSSHIWTYRAKITRYFAI